MLKILLADRFRMTVHKENKEMQVCALTVAKGGPKFHETTTEGPPEFTNGGKGSLVANRVTMNELAQKSSEPLHRPVIHATCLNDRAEKTPTEN